jgi:KTSC domain
VGEVFYERMCKLDAMNENFEAERSSNVGWARWDPATQVLEIDFKRKDGTKQSTYRYENFPCEEWRKFQQSNSKGRHFAYYIRPRFTGIKQ